MFFPIFGLCIIDQEANKVSWQAEPKHFFQAGTEQLEADALWIMSHG